VPVCPPGAAEFPAALPAAHEQVRTLRLTKCGGDCDETAPSVVRLVKGSRMEGMSTTWLAKTSSVSVVTCDGTAPSAASVALELRLPARSAQGQGSAILILSRKTMVAVPDGVLPRRLIGVERLRQGWGRKRTGIARTSRPATGQPTRGTRTPAHASVPIGAWRPGPGERRSVCKTGGCGSSPSSTPSAAADRGRGPARTPMWDGT
jgi:hypothetical protein